MRIKCAPSGAKEIHTEQRLSGYANLGLLFESYFCVLSAKFLYPKPIVISCFCKIHANYACFAMSCRAKHILIAYIYHWKCNTSKFRCTIHRKHLAEYFYVLYAEIGNNALITESTVHPTQKARPFKIMIYLTLYSTILMRHHTKEKSTLCLYIFNS